MPASTLEAILVALITLLDAQTSATVLRNEVSPEAIPAGGLIILRDGEPGEPEVSLSPMRWHYEHQAELEVFVSGPTREADYDTLKQAIGAAVAADRSLGGRCDWIEAEAPRNDDIPFVGGPTVKAGLITVRLEFATLDPLS